MTRPRIEPKSPRPLANTLPTRPIGVVAIEKGAFWSPSTTVANLKSNLALNPKRVDTPQNKTTNHNHQTERSLSTVFIECGFYLTPPPRAGCDTQSIFLSGVQLA